MDPMVLKYPKISVNIPNVRQMCQHFPILSPQKFTQIGSFGLKINNLATLLESAALVGLFCFVFWHLATEMQSGGQS
jgi:hypothetical protein